MKRARIVVPGVCVIRAHTLSEKLGDRRTVASHGRGVELTAGHGDGDGEEVQNGADGEATASTELSASADGEATASTELSAITREEIDKLLCVGSCSLPDTS